jgi:uncharacterized protein (TIGR02996 family)
MPMSTEESFMKAILDAPDDDGLRLVFADWLEERGDPRAEFIRVQFALEQGTEVSAVLTLIHRQQELLHAHREQWAGPVAELADDCTFRCGFVEGVTVDADTFLEKGHVLFQFAPVRSVKLWLADSSVIPKLVACPWLERLEGLSLEQANIGDLGAQVLVDSPKLRQLKHLNLQMNLLELSGARAVAGSPHLARLTSLVLSDNPIGDLGLHAIVASDRLPELVRLELRHCDLSDSGIRGLARARMMGQLDELNLAHNHRIGAAGARALAAAPLLAQLRSLDLSAASMDTSAVKALARSPHLRGLAQLNLSQNLIGTHGAEALVQSPYLTQLRSLHLWNNPLSAEAKKLLKEKFGARVSF